MSQANSATQFFLPVGTTPLSTGTPKILMCPPTYYDVSYAINPWMEEAAPCDVELAKRQWEALYNAITQQAGAEVLLLDAVEGLPDLVFTANAAYIYNNRAIIAHYKYPERRGEEPVCEAWFKKHGFETITLPEHVFFEGMGDALTWGDTSQNMAARVFAGYKTRTDIASHNLISTHCGLPVLSLELINPRYYHIDVCICPLADGHFIYSPQAFDAYGNAVIEANIPPQKRIAVTPEEAARFACNSVNINDTVLFNAGSSTLADELKTRGFNVIQVELGEFLKSGGSSKCLTLRVA